MKRHITTMVSLRLFAVLIITCWLTTSVAEKVPAFSARDYPSGKYQVTQSSHELNDVSIRVIQVKKRKPDGSAPSYCRAWVEVSRGNRLLRQIYYADFEPVGFSYGVFVPSKQPSTDYLVLERRRLRRTPAPR